MQKYNESHTEKKEKYDNFATFRKTELRFFLVSESNERRQKQRETRLLREIKLRRFSVSDMQKRETKTAIQHT